MKAYEDHEAELKEKQAHEEALAAGKLERLAAVYPQAEEIIKALGVCAPDDSELYIDGWSGEKPTVYAELTFHFNNRDSWADATLAFEALEPFGFAVEEWNSENLAATLTRLYRNAHELYSIYIYWQLKENNPSGCYKKHVRKEVNTHVSEKDVWEIVCPQPETENV